MIFTLRIRTPTVKWWEPGDWCEEAFGVCGERWKMTLPSYTDLPHDYWFADATDAIAFKLYWGDHIVDENPDSEWPYP